MSVEDARRSRHCKHVSVCSKCVSVDWILHISIDSILGIMILDEGYGILLIVIIRNKWWIALSKITPFLIVDSINHAITEAEVKGSAGRIFCHITFREVYPLFDVACSIKVFANAESRSHRHIIFTNETCIEAFHHIIAETDIAYVVK